MNEDNTKSKNKPAPAVGNKDITDFLLVEYDKIAQAHFSAHENLSKWVRFYFLVVAAPLSLLVVLQNSIKPATAVDVLHLPVYYSIVIILVGVIGVIISLIIFDIRLDAALYARSVNGIRKYFVDNGTAANAINGTGLIDLFAYVVLPTDINKPSLTHLSINSWIFVLMFTFINWLYICFGILSLHTNWAQPCFIFVLAGAILFIIHVIGYKLIGKHKQDTYASAEKKKNVVS